MNKKWQRILAIILIIVMVLALLPMAAIVTRADNVVTVQSLKAKYPHGKYWNGGIAETYTSTPCEHHTGHCLYSGACGCNSFQGHAIQCMGFAYQLAFLVYGGDPYMDWISNRDASALQSLKAGDVVRYKNNSHSIFVTDVKGDTVTYADCNSDGKCGIRWDQTISKDTLKASFSYVDAAPYAWKTAATPVLTVKYHANGGTVSSKVVSYTYKVTEGSGLSLRSGAGTGKPVVKILPKNAVFTVKKGETKQADGRTWGKTTYDGKTGWIVISNFVKKTATNRNTDYYVSSSLLYKSSTSAVLSHAIPYNTSPKNGLYNASTFALKRAGYRFVGWCTKADGSATIFDQNDDTVKAETIYPNLRKGSKTLTLYAIWKCNHTYKKVTVCATPDKNGKQEYRCTTCDYATKNKAVTIARPAKFKLSTTAYTYNGEAKKPNVTVTDANGKALKKGTDYSVAYASGRTAVGTYKVTVTMKGKYSGSKVLTFKILPPKTTVSKVTSATKSLKASITKKTTQVTGYQIQYSASSKFTSPKTVTVSSYKTTSATIKSLKAKTAYYVRVRTYKTVNGTTYYSLWSTAKTAKTK